MDEVEFYRRLYRYNRQALENFLRRVERMPLKEAEKDRGTGIGSYTATLLHIVRVHEAWVCQINQGKVGELHEAHVRFRKLRGRREARRYFDETWKEIDRYLRALTPAKLRRRVRAPWMPGSYTAADGLVQATFEQAHHLGEIIGAFWQEDRVPPQMMFLPIVTGHPEVSVR